MLKIHDSFWRLSLERPEIAREFLRNYLPKDVKKTFDIKTMKICKDSFIESDLHARQVDILFENEKNQYIILLLEHQSSNDDFMPYRLLKYNVSIWDRFLKNSSSKNTSQNKKKLPLIFNMIFYVRHEVVSVFCCMKKQPNVLPLVTYGDMQNWERYCMKLSKQCTPYRKIANELVTDVGNYEHHVVGG